MEYRDVHIIGAPWCGGCKAARAKLTSVDYPHQITMVPPGPAGWEFVESYTGRRALPGILLDGEPIRLKDFMEYIESLGLPKRELTEQEVEMIQDGDV